jgi:NADPH-dependent 2,4-dienoyl-CoA reductase/sulfur reductase-like enzyme/rhodanese-related sulfurtransferase
MRYDEGAGRVSVQVKDKRIGIPEKEQELVFREFYRSRNAKRFDPSGTGFGMAIVKQVIDLCGGRLELRSRENEGTRVIFTLPLTGVRDRETAELEHGRRKRILVVGGVSAGPKAASRARRLDPEAEITIFDREFFLAYAGCVLPYYISGRIKTQQELAEAVSGFQGGARYFQNVRGIAIKNLCEITAIDRAHRLVRYTDIMTDEEHTMSYDALILATGSTPIVPETIGVNLQNIFVLHGVSDSEKIKSALAEEKAKDIVIVGGGLIGVEIAEALTVSGARITIVEKRDQILPFLDPEMAALVERHLVHQGIRIIKNNSPSAFIGKKTVRAVQLPTFRLPADMVILAMGIRPNVGLAVQAGLEKGPTGALAVNEYLQTNDPAVYAAGDCAETRHAVLDSPYYLPMGSIANRMGRIAGGNATGRQHEPFSPVTGTIIINVFDYHVAKTGLNEGEAGKAGLDTVSSYVPEYDREPFVPGAGIINIKMTACKETGKLLGVQIVGRGEVAKRIDIAAMVIAKRGSVDDIHAVDLGYAPVYSTAVSAIAVAANVLRNKLNGLFEGITSHETHQLLENHQQDCIFLDVRTPSEYEDVKIPGFDLIPLEDLGRRMDEILPDRTVVLACESGMRSYQAYRILRAKGFERVRVLEGGIRMWPYALSRG